jgi:hypothetical protein
LNDRREEPVPDSLKSFALRSAAGALVVIGMIAVVAGYLGVRDQSDVVLQLPYAISGGVGGLGLILVGALVLVYAQMREQTQRAAEIIDSLEEWKEAALAEVRAFLEDATIEVDLSELVPPPSAAASNGRAKKATTAARN